MKKIYLKAFFAFAVALMTSAILVSCGDDDTKQNPETQNQNTTDQNTKEQNSQSVDITPIAKTYKVNTYADTQAGYFTKYQPTENQDLQITVNDDRKTVTVEFTSTAQTSWGTFIFPAAEVTLTEGTYSVKGEGTDDMPNPHSGTTSQYSAKLDITIVNDNLTGTIEIPGVMGGVTIFLNPEDFVAETPATVSNADLIANLYKVNSYSQFMTFDKYQPTANQNLVILANDDKETVKVEFTSTAQTSWGSFTFPAIPVTKEGDTYVIEGEGTTQISNPRNPSAGASEYSATIAATITDGIITGTITIPDVHGATIFLNPADFDEVFTPTE